MATTALLLLLLLVSLASASHYYGGQATFSYKGRNPDGTLKVDIRKKSTFGRCHSFLSWNCYWGNCGFSRSSVRGTIDSSTNGQQCETETVTRRHVSDKPFSVRAASCCWVLNRNNVQNWRLLTHVDLGTRSDTGLPNRSPDISTLGLLRTPQNCRRTYNLLAFDADGDQVRCRYGNAVNTECSRCVSNSGFNLDEGSCLLHYNHAQTNSRVFAFELMVEDYPRQPITLSYSDGTQSFRYPGGATIQSPHTTTSAHTYNRTWPQPTTASPWRVPLSKLPMQFSFRVDPPAPSCNVGVYLPALVNPTPAQGTRIHAEINKEVEIRVKAQATSATIQNIMFSGPLNATKHRTTHDEFIIKWTPTSEDLGDHFTVCFAVEATASSRIYQSEMRCVILDVEEEEVKTNVICSESTMRVEVEKASLRGLHEDHLRLTDSTNTACDLETHSNSTHVIGVFPLNSCGTTLEEDETNLIFKNEITTVDDLADVITRKHLLEVDFFCEYPKRGNVTLGFSVHRKNVTVWERGMGTFTYQFEFFPDNGFRSMINPNTYPLEFEIGTRIYMQIEATSTVNNTQLFVESCRAAPYDIPNYSPSYSIIENGCAVDMTVMMHPRDDNQQFRFSMEAFKFIGLHDQVYIQCSVMMCEAGNPNTRCARGCMNMRGRDKRDATIQSASHFVSQGPLRLKRSADISPVASGNLNLNLAFIAGCLLAAVGMISAVIMYRTRMSTVKYQPLPSSEN